jgi:hypothetical protein
MISVGFRRRRLCVFFSFVFFLSSVAVPLLLLSMRCEKDNLEQRTV